jgi:hypothetical protein
MQPLERGAGRRLHRDHSVYRRQKSGIARTKQPITTVLHRRMRRFGLSAPQRAQTGLPAAFSVSHLRHSQAIG